MACCRCCCRQREDERAGPHFFKIILSDTLDSGKLGIPRRFLKKYGNHLSSLAFLKVPLGSNWPIELKKCNDGTVWLQKGWREFMEYYSIGHGHLIVFKYEGDSTFRAIIFDKSTSEIDYSSSSGGVSNHKAEFLSRKRINVIEAEDSKNFRPCKRLRAKSYLSLQSLSCSSGEFEGMIKQSRRGESNPGPVFRGPTRPSPLTRLKLASKFESEHPFFKVVMPPSSMKTSLGIPHGFVKKHIQENKETATLRYSDRSWPVKLIKSHSRNHVVSFGTGWLAFARETRICVRDVCVFELIDKNDIVFDVSIFCSAGMIKQSRCHPACPSPVSSLELASRFESENPFFTVVMQPTHIKRYMRVPRGFMKQHIVEVNQTVTLRYSDRSWPVEFRFYRRERAGYFSSPGWSVFTRETGLRVRDICVFELIGCGFPMFEVSIFRSFGPELI